MDSNTFTILLLTLITVIIVFVIWQIFSLARARAGAAASQEQKELLHGIDERHLQLDQRLASLAGDVQELSDRVDALDQREHA